ncbi:MAG: dihydrodipicolinate synthase family protein [Chloroflexi bacterium]|nr:dihydrodipicolinate synthase family protein [Chloroflexota bacterium]
MKDLGPVIPIVTPCTPDGNLDLDGFRSVCNEMLEVGCKGIFIAGTTGRGPWFSLSERARLCRTAADQIRATVPLFAGCTSSGLPGMLENARAMADSGAQVAVATVPTYFHYNQVEIETVYSKFADASPLPVIVYDIPEFTNVKLADDMVLRLARHGNIIGFKDSSADLERFKGLVDALQSYPDFYLMQGKENLIAESIRMGASGFIVSLMHIDPLPFTAVYRAVRAGNFQLAESIQVEINKVIQLVKESIEKRPESSTLFHMLNYALQKRGVCKNILLDHDDKAPAWVIENAQRAIELCLAAAALPQN